MKEIIKTDKAPQPVGPYSQAVKVGNFLFLSGQIPYTSEGKLAVDTIQEQTRQVLENLKAVLEAADADMNNVVKVTVYLEDMNDFGEMNKIYAEYFKEKPPARAAVEVARLPKDAKIEIELIAYIS